jgi:hypothetical protein
VESKEVSFNFEINGVKTKKTGRIIRTHGTTEKIFLVKTNNELIAVPESCII